MVGRRSWSGVHAVSRDGAFSLPRKSETQYWLSTDRSDNHGPCGCWFDVYLEHLLWFIAKKINKAVLFAQRTPVGLL